MIKAGDAFRSREYPHHVFIPITTPNEDGYAVILNLTDAANDGEDCSCILKREDYPQYIRFPTVPLYREAFLGFAGGFLNRQIESMPSLPPETLLKIQEGALVSKAIKPNLQEIIRVELRV